MKIRNAAKKDLINIARFMLGEFIKPPFNEKVKVKSVLKSLEFYHKLGNVLVAVDDGVVGVVVFKVEQWWEGPVLLIEDLASKNDDLLIAESLMKTVEVYAKKRKIKVLSFTTHKNSTAMKRYPKQGYHIEKNTVFMTKRMK